MKLMDEKLPVSGDQNESERSKAICELQKAIDQGFSSGPVIPFDPDLFRGKMHKACD